MTNEQHEQKYFDQNFVDYIEEFKDQFNWKLIRNQ
jgi:hypothetical protein